MSIGPLRETVDGGLVVWWPGEALPTAEDLAAFTSAHRDEMDAWSVPSDEHALPERLRETILAAG